MVLFLLLSLLLPVPHCLPAAGRWDVHNAIVRNGGYREVAQLLDRRLSWPVPNTLDTPTALRQALAELCSERGWAAGVLPSMRHLRDADRDDVIKVRIVAGVRHKQTVPGQPQLPNSLLQTLALLCIIR